MLCPHLLLSDVLLIMLDFPVCPVYRLIIPRLCLVTDQRDLKVSGALSSVRRRRLLTPRQLLTKSNPTSFRRRALKPY